VSNSDDDDIIFQDDDDDDGDDDDKNSDDTNFQYSTTSHNTSHWPKDDSYIVANPNNIMVQ